MSERQAGQVAGTACGPATPVRSGGAAAPEQITTLAVRRSSGLPALPALRDGDAGGVRRGAGTRHDAVGRRTAG